MLEQHKRQSNIFVGLGLIAQIAGRLMIDRAGDSTGTMGLGVILALGGLVAFIWGCAEFARAKGHSPAWGLLGIFSLLGLLVLLILRDRYPDGRPTEGSQPAPPAGFSQPGSPPAELDR